MKYFMKNDSIKELTLSGRTYNTLMRVGITTINQLLALSIDDLESIKNLGQKGYEEIEQTIRNIKVIDKNNLKDKNISVMLIGLNDNEDIQLKYITDVKETEYSDKKIVWFTHSYGENAVNTNNGNYINDIFAVYSDYGYAIEIKAQNNTSED